MKRNQSKKTTSIAVKINLSYWFRSLFRMLFLDVVILGLTAGSFFMWAENKAQELGTVIDREIDTNEEGEPVYVISVEKKQEFRVEFSDVGQVVGPPFCILLSVEGVMLIFALFHTGGVRRKLRPLNDLALQAEELSSIPLDAKMEELAKAIDHVETNSANVRVKTGDSDLQSIEIALNNLLKRMQESQKQQARFVSDASHELRTPISVIQGYVNMLDRWGKEDEKVLEEAIEALKNESEHMKELVEQLLFLARGDSGRNTLNFVDFDLNEIVREVWEESVMIDEEHMYRCRIGDSLGNMHDPYEAEIEVIDEDEQGGTESIQAAPYSPAMVHGDVAMIKQSMRIFIQNAAKYSHKGDTIDIGVKWVDGRPAYVVQDEGIGMQSKDVSHIFERFYRSDEARNGNTGGSGLGLSIAKWIVDAHNGTIEVLSRPEFGTRFTVKL